MNKFLYLIEQAPEAVGILFLTLSAVASLSLLITKPAPRNTGHINGLGTNEVDPSKVPDVEPGTILTTEAPDHAQG